MEFKWLAVTGQAVCCVRWLVVAQERCCDCFTIQEMHTHR
jgi:hypothetical protein